MTPQTTPKKLNLKRDEKLEVVWADGRTSVYPLQYLRAKCPCASCKVVREEQAVKKSRLNILPGNYANALRAEHAELVGNYALQLEWSDEHGSGIYSFDYLREISPQEPAV